jgi:aquaporin Z
MTIAPYWLDEPHTQSVLVENPRTFDKCAVEALGTFGPLLTVGVGMYSRTPLAALGIGVVLMALIYAGGLEIGGFGRPMMCVEVHILGCEVRDHHGVE